MLWFLGQYLTQDAYLLDYVVAAADRAFKIRCVRNFQSRWKFARQFLKFNLQIKINLLINWLTHGIQGQRGDECHDANGHRGPEHWRRSRGWKSWFIANHHLNSSRSSSSSNLIFCLDDWELNEFWCWIMIPSLPNQERERMAEAKGTSDACGSRSGYLNMQTKVGHLWSLEDSRSQELQFQRKKL